MKTDKILLIEDDRGLLDLLQDELEAEGYDVWAVASVEEADRPLAQWGPDLVVSDMRLPGEDGLSILSRLPALSPRPAILFITAFGTVQQAVEALKAGADDFMTKPLDLDHFHMTVDRLLANRRLHREVEQYKSLLAADRFHGMVASSPKMLNLHSQIKRIAVADGPVLILGESGTGKELVAGAVHEESARRDGPYLAVNCGGIPGELMESEFFGHSAGAFTGARSKRLGLFQQADGGTLLLDEIGEMPLPLQAKLLRVLQDGEIRSVGSDHHHRVDVRILAATNKNLDNAVEEGRFREDLYYRLETFALEVPPLRERGDDVLLLADHFLTRFAARRQIPIRGLSDEALECLRHYPFPGNIRELENAIERAVTFCDTEVVQVQHLPGRIRQVTTPPAATPEAGLPEWAVQGETPMDLETLQKRYIDFVLKQQDGNKRRAASILGITRRTLYRWLQDS